MNSIKLQREYKKEKKDPTGYYKKRILCRVSKKYYGSDAKTDNSICPKCDWRGTIKGK